MASARVVPSSLLLEQVFSVLRFPLWWYSHGLEEVIAWSWTGLKARWSSLQIGLWSKSFFRPMYGVQDLWGRAISVFMRSVVIAGRVIFWIFEAIAYTLLILFWCLWPIVCLILIALSLAA